MSDTTIMFIPSQILNYAAAKTTGKLNDIAIKAMEKVIVSKAMANVLQSMIAGTVLSIGSNYATDMINVGAKYVLDYGSQFGGVSQKESSVLKLLGTRSGISYYLHGLRG